MNSTVSNNAHADAPDLSFYLVAAIHLDLSLGASLEIEGRTPVLAVLAVQPLLLRFAP